MSTNDLPEYITAEDAVRLMIEGDGRLRLPIYYEAAFAPFFIQLDLCEELLTNLCQSAMQNGSEADVRSSRKNAKNIRHIIELAKSYRGDLNYEIYRATKEDDSRIELHHSSPDSNDPPLILTASLIDWAFVVPKVDIFGIHARRHSPNRESGDFSFSVEPAHEPSRAEIKRWGEKHLLSGDSLWEQVKRGSRSGHSTEPGILDNGRILFLAIAWFLDTLLSRYDAKWKERVTDISCTISNPILLNGELNHTTIINEVIRHLSTDVPPNVDGKIRNHIDEVMPELLSKEITKDHFTKRELPAAFRTLYGLSRATYRKRLGSISQENLGGKDPSPEALIESMISKLTEPPMLHVDDLRRCIGESYSRTEEK